METLRSFKMKPLETRRHIPEDLDQEAEPSFVSSQAYTIFGSFFKKKATKWRTKVNTRIFIYNSSFIKIGQE